MAGTVDSFGEIQPVPKKNAVSGGGSARLAEKKKKGALSKSWPFPFQGKKKKRANGGLAMYPCLLKVMGRKRKKKPGLWSRRRAETDCRSTRVRLEPLLRIRAHAQRPHELAFVSGKFTPMCDLLLSHKNWFGSVYKNPEGKSVKRALFIFLGLEDWGAPRFERLIDREIRPSRHPPHLPREKSDLAGPEGPPPAPPPSRTGGRPVRVRSAPRPPTAS